MSPEERLKICKACPLWKMTSWGGVCDGDKYINAVGDVSYFPRDGYVQGCNCRLNYKTKDPFSHCNAGKW